jgi:hypothetical protein
MRQNTAGFSQLMTSLVGIYFPEMVKLKKKFFVSLLKVNLLKIMETHQPQTGR